MAEDPRNFSRIGADITHPILQFAIVCFQRSLPLLFLLQLSFSLSLKHFSSLIFLRQLYVFCLLSPGDGVYVPLASSRATIICLQDDSRPLLRPRRRMP